MEHVKTAYRVDGQARPVVKLETQTGEGVHVMRYDADISSAVQLDALIQQLHTGASSGENSMSIIGVTIPMVDFSEEGDIGWLVGAQTTGTDGCPAVVL